MEKLFSYGTLRYESVQMATFGRKLTGNPATLIGYCLSTMQITNPDVVATSGEAVHPVLIYTGNKADTVNGIAFNVSSDELLLADQYEEADYKRIRIHLDSGEHAWVYLAADGKK